MQTEFTCGIYTASLNGDTNIWQLNTGVHHIGNIHPDGLLIQFRTVMLFPQDNLIEIAVLMNNIKRQYKQLNNG